jgi:2-aminoadipate transaminase
VTSVLPQGDVISFARGVPGADLLPVDALERCAAAAIRRDGRVALNYGPAAGYGPLREWIGERHGVPAGRVMLTPGSMLGLDLLLAELLDGGGAAAVEAPSYDRALRALAAHAGELLPIARGESGLDLDALAAAARRPDCRLLYVLATFHNPTGLTLSLEERRGLAALAIERDLLVVEDDPYGLTRFEGDPLPTVYELLRAQGADELAAYASSFSKSVAPGLRVGYLLLPTASALRFEARALRTYVSPPLLPQAQLLEFLLHGGFADHLAALRASLRARRDALCDGLAEELPAGAVWTRPAGGYFLWLDLPAPLDTAELLEPARHRGVDFVPGAGFFPHGAGARSARLAFSHPAPAAIREGTRRLGALVRERLTQNG